MIDSGILEKFIFERNFDQSSIDYFLESNNLTAKQLIRKTFKFLNAKIGVIQDNTFFINSVLIPNTVEFLYALCENTDFNEEEVITNRLRIKKSREALLAIANKYQDSLLMDAANRLDEIILDKNINLDDLRDLLFKLIEKKEDINIIKKLLNTNKGVLLLNRNILFDHVFELSLKAIKENNSLIYYYIALLKVFYSSNINRKEYLDRLNKETDDTNTYANEIYLIILGVRRGLTPEQILNKYGIVTQMHTPHIWVPSREYYDEQIITIDGENTKLRDDAVSIREEGDFLTVGIHISDPTYLIKPDSPEDLLARNNYRNIYLGDRSVRLFSQELEDTFSLDENKPRKTISMYVTFDKQGNIKYFYFTQNVIRVTNNLSKEQCNRALTDYDKDLTKPLQDLYRVASALQANNLKKNVYWFKKDTSSFDKKLDESQSDLIVAELMVLYNISVATNICNKSLPYVYRVQDPSYIKNLVKKMHIEVDDSTQRIINSIYLNSKYSTQPRFHNGLHIPIYSHSTDPLRRYPDLYNLYLLHTFYFNDMYMDFDNEEFEKWVDYFNQRNVELSLMKGEYERALKLKKS